MLHPPLTSAPLTARSTHHDRDGLLLEKLKLSRGTTPWAFAEAHARGWAQTVRDAQSQPMIAAGTMAAAFEHELQAARARLTMWAAADISIVSRLTATQSQWTGAYWCRSMSRTTSWRWCRIAASLGWHARKGSWPSSQPDWRRGWRLGGDELGECEHELAGGA